VKPTDKAIFRMVSESPGRNGSEPVVASTKNKHRRPSYLVYSEGNMARRKLTEATRHSGGVVRDSTVTKDMLSNWRSRPRPIEKIGGATRSYNRRNREVDGRRDGDGQVRSSDEVG